MVVSLVFLLHRGGIFSEKLDLLSVLTIVLLSVSITLFDFDDFSWVTNSKSYFGLIGAGIILAIRSSVNRKAK